MLYIRCKHDKYYYMSDFPTTVSSINIDVETEHKLRLHRVEVSIIVR